MTPRRPPHDITDAEKQAKAMVRNVAPVTSTSVQDDLPELRLDRTSRTVTI